MRHQRHFAETARAFVGVEHLVQHLLAARGFRLDDASLLESHRDAVDQRALVGQRLGADDMPVDAPGVRRGEDLFGRDVRIAGDAVLGGRGAALPFMAVGKSDRQVRARPGIMQRVKPVPFSHSVRLRSAALCAAQAATGSSMSTREAAKIASASFATATPSSSPGNTCLRPGHAGIGDDIPVDVEVGDLFERRLIGDGIGLVGARDLGRVLGRQQHRIVADDGEPRGVAGERLGDAVIKPAGGAVEARVPREAIARQRDLLVREDRRDEARRRPYRRVRRSGAPAAAPRPARSGTGPALACSCSPTLTATSASLSSFTGIDRWRQRGCARGLS